MSERTRKPDDEMLITHLPPAAERDMAHREEAVRTSGTEEPERAKLASELAAAPTESQRRKLIESIQERFGNEVAKEIVSEARLQRLSGDEGDAGRSM